MNMHVNPEEFKPTRRSLLRTAPAAGLAAMMAGAVPAAQAEPDIMHHVREIERLLNADLPEGATLKGFEFRCGEDGIDPASIWASGLTEGFNLCHARPGVFDGWRETTLKLAGAV